MSIVVALKKILKATNLYRKYNYLKSLYNKYSRTHNTSKVSFTVINFLKIKVFKSRRGKAYGICKLLKNIDITHVNNASFLYSIDCYKTISNINRIFENYTIDYSCVVHNSLARSYNEQTLINSNFHKNEILLINGMKTYVERLKRVNNVSEKYSENIEAVESLFVRPAKTFFEALQRILFINQFLWQTRHTLNGLGRLDNILGELYSVDIGRGILTREKAKELLKDFLRTLHEYYWFKSNSLVGDTGQIIILGGKNSDGSYVCNELTYLFIEVSKELKLPDPKVLLRCTANMPDDLLKMAIECISTGIGAPLLSNDDVVIDSMISCGFEEKDAYEYCTAACWEPLVPGISCDANNITSFNFAVPLIRLFESNRFDRAESVEEIVKLYVDELNGYIDECLLPFTELEFEEDTFLSLFSKSAVESQKDITRGGAKYSNFGLTSVGLGTTVNSILNIRKLIFVEKRYSLTELNKMRKENFLKNDALIAELKDLAPAYGSDDNEVVKLTKYIMFVTSQEFSKYSTKYGGRFKIGLSSPSYIDGAKEIPATLDGRRLGEPFSVHISSVKAIPITELLSFAMKLDYNDNRLNGNVIDFFTTPDLLKQNINKFISLLKAGFAGGIFQLQMNVVASKTLIEAKEDPKLFPDLIVRVWGFSAYFNDLPEEYKEVIIARAIESEKVA